MTASLPLPASLAPLVSAPPSRPHPPASRPSAASAHSHLVALFRFVHILPMLTTVAARVLDVCSRTAWDRATRPDRLPPPRCGAVPNARHCWPVRPLGEAVGYSQLRSRRVTRGITS